MTHPERTAAILHGAALYHAQVHSGVWPAWEASKAAYVAWKEAHPDLAEAAQALQANAWVRASAWA